MTEPTRKLAAIVFTDIVGFTKLSAENEPAALSLLEKQREFLKPIVEKHGGSWLKEIGDGLLLSFNTSLEAVNCAIALQKTVKDIDDLNLRIGIHQGEVVFQGNDVVGDDVNIAARIEPFAAPGGIAISGRVNASLERDPEFKTHYLGQPQLKGVSQSVKAYCITSHGLPQTDMTQVDAKLEPEGFEWNTKNILGIAASAIGLFLLINFMFLRIGFADEEETPSIAILPFENKGSPEDDFYAYGISSDLISDVTGAGLIRVAGLNDIEKLEYNQMSYSELSNKLFVRYVAKGTLWKLDSIFQLSMEIFDTELSKVIYTKRWQTAWKDLATIKDDLSDNILETLEIEVLGDVEGQIVESNPEAYEYYLRASHKYKKRQNTDDTEITQGLLRKAMELDDNLVEAKLLLGTTYRDLGEYDKALKIYKQALTLAKKLGDKKKTIDSNNNIVSVFWMKGELDSILFYRKKSYEISVELDNKHYISGNLIGIGYAYIRKSDYDSAIINFEKALAIYEELDDKAGIGVALQSMGNAYSFKGDHEKSIDFHKKSLANYEELGDNDKLIGCLMNLGWEYNKNGDYENAIAKFERALPLVEELGNKQTMGVIQSNFGKAYTTKGDYDKALESYDISITIAEELGDKNTVGYVLKDIGHLYLQKKDMDKALDYYERANAILEEVGNKHGIGYSLDRIGNVYLAKGDYDNALEHFGKAKEIHEERGNRSGVMWSLLGMGDVHFNQGDKDKALDYFERSFDIRKEIETESGGLWSKTYLFLTYKHFGVDYDVKEIHQLIDETDEIEYETHFRLYELLEDSNHLKKAYDKVQEKANDLENELKEKYLSYPIPKQIIDEYKKVLS